MIGSDLAAWALSILLLSLRVAPVFAFAPPFSLVRMPVLFRLLFGLALAACLVSGNSEATLVRDLSAGSLAIAAIRELLLGTVIVLAFQLSFGALYFAGRTIDIQTGFGLALLIDPTTRAQTPLVGTLFAYAAGAVFFAVDGHLSTLRILAATLEAVPVGAYLPPHSIGPLTTFVSIIFLLAFGVAGVAMLSLFLADLAVAMLARTVPQMNVLILGFQIKSIILLVALPVTLGVAGGALTKLMAFTLESVPRLI